MIADDIVAKGDVPAQYKDPCDEMLVDMKADLDELENVKDELIPKVRIARDENGNEQWNEDGEAVMELHVDDQGQALMEPHWHKQIFDKEGFLRYRYELQSDGSVLALYVTSDKPDTVQLKAFNNIETASQWSPRDEKVTQEA